MEATTKKRILLTGAAGRIGTAFRQYAGHRYALRLAFHHTPVADPGEHEVFGLDVSDLESCQRACAGMDMVVHMAADPHPTADFYASLLPNNILGPYNILRAAKDQGCQRAILASSVQAVDGYPLDVQIRPEMPVWPASLYGAAKAFTEAAAKHFAYNEGLSCVCIRIGSFESERMIQQLNPHRLSKFVTRRDMSHLIERSIETPNIRFALLHGVSNNRFKRLDITSTRELVGYDPQDDAFQLFGYVMNTADPWSR